MPFLEIAALNVCYGRLHVLREVSLAVEQGTLVALLGSSGCGKTTLLRAVAGFVETTSGRIVLAGRDITHLPPERRNTAMVFQSYALWPHMNVAQNMAYGLRLRHAARPDIRRKVESLLSLLHLDGLAGRNVTRLSGGQRQRVALGRALAVDPEMLLLDEPLSNLDARIRLELRHEIRAIQTRLGITALHVTHDREEAMVMADRIVVLRDGEIAQEGAPEEVYNRPANAFVATFMGADNVVRLSAQAAPDGLLVQPAETGTEERSLLRIGEGGVHLPSGPAGAMFDAHFRATAARLLPEAVPAPEGSLAIQGVVRQVSYPGGLWRYAVHVGQHRFLIDDMAPHAAGAQVRVVIPGAGLHLFPVQPR